MTTGDGGFLTDYVILKIVGQIVGIFSDVDGRKDQVVQSLNHHQHRHVIDSKMDYYYRVFQWPLIKILFK